MSALSNESFSQWVCAEVTLPFSAVAQQLKKEIWRSERIKKIPFVYWKIWFSVLEYFHGNAVCVRCTDPGVSLHE